MTQVKDNNNLLTAYKPRPWGEELTSNAQGYSRPDPSSKTHIPTRESKTGTGSGVIPWN